MLATSHFALFVVCFFVIFVFFLFVFLRIRRPPRSTLDRSSAASDVYKRQVLVLTDHPQAALAGVRLVHAPVEAARAAGLRLDRQQPPAGDHAQRRRDGGAAVSYTHLRAHATVLDLVCRLLLGTQKESN